MPAQWAVAKAGGYICRPLPPLTQKIAIIGAGPAGLTAAYLLSKMPDRFTVTVFEQDAQYVGGISRTELYKNYRFDIGGHRFFSKSREVEALWTEILGDQMLTRPRSSRIYYGGKFYSYPLRAFDVLKKLGILEAARCMASYAKTRLSAKRTASNFEEWVSNEFGERLYRIFFKTYTEKVWGMPCTEISADWAAQRIKGLNLSKTLYHAIKPQQGKQGKGTIKTLIDTFRYPKYGPGQMWEACRDMALANGVELLMDTPVSGLEFEQAGNRWWVNTRGRRHQECFDAVISSAPLKLIVENLRPTPPQHVLAAADRLSYRDFITVVLMMPDKKQFPDNWIYIHDPGVKVGRIQNFKSWSPYMVPDQSMVCYGLEYFCFEGDGMWTASDDELIELAKKEISIIGLASAGEVSDAHVVRQPKAYPVYDNDYSKHVETIAEGLKAYPGLMLTGRNGMHKYNNQDHSMMTAMLAVKNLEAGETVYDLWRVNQDAEYHEEGETDFTHQGGRAVPVAGNS